MEKIKTSQDVDYRRRHFIGAAALALAAAQLGMIGAVDAQPGKAKLPSIKPESHTSFGPLKQIDAGLLNVGYAEAGPADKATSKAGMSRDAATPRSCVGRSANASATAS